jgi:predicted nucleic acid-binding protein
MIFVDTGAWFALFVPFDPDHAEAVRWSAANTEPLITTDFVVDETLTLLRARGERRRALRAADEFFQGGLSQLEFLTRDDVLAAWQVFLRFADKDWSFTDCTSKVVIERLQLTTAFAFDHHFHQFGTVQVVP